MTLRFTDNSKERSFSEAAESQKKLLEAPSLRSKFQCNARRKSTKPRDANTTLASIDGSYVYSFISFLIKLFTIFSSTVSSKSLESLHVVRQTKRRWSLLSVGDASIRGKWQRNGRWTWRGAAAQGARVKNLMRSLRLTAGQVSHCICIIKYSRQRTLE